MTETEGFKAPIKEGRPSIIGRLYAKALLFPDDRDYLEGLDGGEELYFDSPTGRKLFGMRIPGQCDADSSNRPTIVFFHGNSGNLTSHWLYIDLLRQSGWDVFAFDYGGFGRSTGKACVVEMISDALAACEEAKKWNREKGFSGLLGLFGLSVGSNLALWIASRVKGIGAVAVEGVQIQREMIRGITVDGLSGPRWIENLSYSDGEAIERERFRFPGLRLPEPFAGWMGKMAELTYPFPGKDASRSSQALDKIPLFVSHGISDRLLPFETALRVYQEAPSPKRIWLIPHVGHAQDPALCVDEEYRAQIQHFYHQALIEPNPVWDEVQVEKQDDKVNLSLSSSLAGRAYCLLDLYNDQMVLHRPFLEPGVSHKIDLLNPESELILTPMFSVEKSGSTWQPKPSERSKIYSGDIGSTLKALSSKLHDRQIEGPRDLLSGLLKTNPPFPFNFLARLHCARLEDLAKKKNPQIAQEARTYFNQLMPRSSS